MKYMVMEVYDSYAIVLDSDGRFIKTANLHYTPGQTVTEIFAMKEETTSYGAAKLIPWKNIIAAAACFLVMAAGLFGYISRPYASVFISINPSVRIDIDKNETVKKITGTNADGENLIQGYDYTGKNLDTAVDELVDMAIEQGYLYDGGQITVTLEGESRWVQTNEPVLGEHINRHMQQKLAVSIQVGRDYHTETQIVIPATDYNESDYGTSPADTDYGPYNDGVTDYDKPDNDSDYTRSDYTDGATDYGDHKTNASDYENSSDYKDD